MTLKLASLVLPDKTPIRERPVPAEAEPKPRRAARRLRLPSRREKVAAAAPASRTEAGKGDRGDWAIVGAGLSLALVCALFPWYIFFNQEDFGIRPVTFESARQGVPAEDSRAPAVLGERSGLPDRPFPILDMQATGTVPPDEQRAAALSAQPFPGAEPNFKLILVANARAMIQDDDGFWVVQRGSWLPDGSRVASIEQRQGGWVLVTSRDAVVPLSK